MNGTDPASTTIYTVLEAAKIMMKKNAETEVLD